MHHKKLGLAAALTAVISTSAIAEDKVLNVYNWSDYVDPAIIEAFEAETGIKVNYDVYDSNEVLEAKLMSGGSGYDVVVPTGAFLERQIQAGIYKEIDRSKLTNYANLDTVLTDKISRHDPDNKHNVPWAWGTIGLGYNEAMVKERLGPDAKLDSLDMIFKPEVAEKLADCGIGILDSPAEVVSVALNYLGMDPNSEKKSDLKKAKALLSSVRPHYKYFHSSKYIADLASGEICLTLGYNGDVLQSQSRAEETGQGHKIGYSIPTEGTLVWFDLMAIPSDAPHPEAAHKFIDHMLKAESGAGVANYVYYAVANKASEPLLNQDVITNPGIYPSDEVKANLFTQNAHTAKFDRQLTRAWTSIKTGR
ncbi:polyamine ABC transporter substrate-binding protein [Neptuniibacter caesariensis]|uniref:Putrescine-binding periplasmic protein n=1 Tax=Neptuniibacter caesariensis TaxID=207954 RepID=A0A7U8GR39_NEPCE|nr:polyamine ABC transporter substrate-binding protein [Neptuniibacter caesariensis]EAR59951.1 putrescine ABC transporter, periplasmic putrescine-binding protein [Oceanospirillum sp. MED92] [Neptuniibacter caesariensis]